MLIAKSLLIASLVIFSAFVVLPYLLLSTNVQFLVFDIGVLRYSGAVIVGIGLVFMIWVVFDFALSGKGTPAPFDPPRLLVTKGLHKRVRNPMYIGAVLTMMGEGVLFQSAILLLAASLMWLGFHLFVVFYEEPDLKRRFGEPYENYCKEVPRWLPCLMAKRK